LTYFIEQVHALHHNGTVNALYVLTLKDEYLSETFYQTRRVLLTKSFKNNQIKERTDLRITCMTQWLVTYFYFTQQSKTPKKNENKKIKKKKVSREFFFLLSIQANNWRVQN
jgi:hypothetical protein